jgi:hypothetical protein
MAKSRKSLVSEHRRRMKRRGLVRIEVQVHKDDAPLVRRVAKALGDPQRAAEARALLRGRFAEPRGRGLKALLAAAPLEGVDLARDRDMGRSVEL